MKVREPRRKVMLEARLRTAASWHDARILNLSPRGLMMQTSAALSRNAYLEIRRGSHVIVARVVWTTGHSVGLKAQDRLSVEAIVTDTPVSKSTGDCHEDRRKLPRDTQAAGERSRHTGRIAQAVGLGLAGVFGATIVAMIASEAFGASMHDVTAALAGSNTHSR